MLLLAGILAATIAIQLATPLVASRFIDAAVGGRLDGDAAGPGAAHHGPGPRSARGSRSPETWVAERISWGATNALREDLAAHLLRLDAAFHHAHTPGELIERVDGDVGTLARFFSRFTVYVVGNALLMVGILVLLFALDWRIGLGLTLFVAIALVTMLRLRAVATPYSAAERQAAADFYGFLGEYLAGLEDIRASGARRFVLRRCAELMRGWLAARMRAQMRGYGMVATSQGLFGLGMAFALALSAMLYRDGALTIGAVFLVFRYTEMLRQPTEQIRNEMQDLQQADASLGRIEALLAERSRLVDGPEDRLPPGPLAVELDDVWFGYEPDAPVLRDVTLHLEPRRVLGVVGRTGQRQDDAHAAAAALLRSGRRRRAPGRRRSARRRHRRGALPHRPGDAGGAPLQRQRARQPHPLRRRRAGRPPRRRPRSRSAWARGCASCRTGSTPCSAPAAAGSPPVRRRCWPAPASSCATRTW